jgi:GTP pyrophosphokinase
MSLCKPRISANVNVNDDVILIKIADRHNMQTMESRKQVKNSFGDFIYLCPLAHRLGLYNIKNKLEDLGLKYTESHL